MQKIRNYISSGMPYYKRMILVAIPIMIQNGVTNFVSMLDNIMVGRVGTLEMTGVSIVNQLMLVFNLCIFGAMSGVGIFTAQFFGKKDDEGIKNTLQFKLVFSVVVTAVGVLTFLLLSDPLISAYIKDDSDPADILKVTSFAKGYLKIMLWGTLPFAFSQGYAGTLRETSDRVTPMVATIVAVLVNLVLNYGLIFGNLGMPELGVNGAAIATVVSRFTELFILVFWSHTHTKKYPFIKKLFGHTTLNAKLIKKIIVISIPLMVNEGIWSAGMAFLNQCYSLRGLEVVASINILSTLTNVFNVSFIALGCAIGIILSQMLGANEKQQAKECSTKLLAFSVAVVVIIGAVMAAFAPVFPKIYNTSDTVRELACQLILITAVFMPVMAFTNACYFTLRSGGNTMVTFIFDSGFVCLISIPVAFSLSRFTSLPILYLYTIIQSTEIIKCVIGYAFMKKGTWLNRVVE